MKTVNQSSIDENEAIVASASISSSANTPADEKERSTWYYSGSGLSDLKVDAQAVWADYRGSGIKVGVLDSQIDFTHVELTTAYDRSLDYDFANKTSDPLIDTASLPDSHGTRVAGIISAEAGNGSGSAGLASKAKLVGLAINYSSNTVVDDILAGLNSAVSLDVVNNSWSFTKALSDNFATNARLQAPLIKLAGEGRGGLGTSMVFAAGNDGDDSSSNYHNFQNSPFAIAVGAVETDGDAARFSSRGANILLSAAGVDVFTTTVGGGYAEANGTSFAAPAVTAAIALMLEANPELGYRDVQEILAYSSVRKGLDHSPLFGEGWQYNGATNHNGGGLHYSDAFGYGFLNVHNAVRLAETWQSQSTLANRTTVSQTVQSDAKMIAGVDNKMTVKIEVTDTLSLEHVQLSIKTNYGSAGDLDLYLISPQGTKVRLVYDVEGGSKTIDSISGFTFTSVASMGENSQGTWTIEFVDRRPAADIRKGTEITLSEAKLTLHGSALALENDTYIYTDEFIGFYTGDDLAARSKLTDSDGGVDTINTAAIGAAVIVDLSGVRASSLGGQALTIAANQIENLFTGDGNDKLYGSAAKNVMAAGRGNDALYFSLGSDKLDGGSGTDTLFVDQSLASVTVKILAAGTVFISAGAQVYSEITNVETFNFNGASFTLQKLIDTFGLSETAPIGGGDSGTGGTGGSGGSGSGGGTGSGGSTGGGTGGGTGQPPQDPDRSQFASVFEGTSGGDKKSGSTNADLLLGEGGKDNLSGGLGQDFLDGGEGNDKLYGDDGSDYLFGGKGADSLFGGAGNDVIRGGGDGDKLQGGAGADTFVFDFADLGAVDTITDFNVAEGDRVVISGLAPSAATVASFVKKNSAYYLQITVGDETIDLAKVKGVDLALATLESVEVDLLFV